MGNLDFSANADQLKELAAYMASQINVPTIGIGGGYAPIGTINFFDATVAPQDWLACDGSVYNIADYPQLAEWYATQHGASNFYGGNGTTTFAVPNLQGEFLRGTGTNSHENQGSGANVGEHQDATEHMNDGTTTDDLEAFHMPGAPIKTDSLIGNVAGRYSSMSSLRTGSRAVYYTSRPTNTSFLICVKAVVAGEVYSTEERVVGTWIDGSNLYQKTVRIQPLPNKKETNYPHGISNMDEVIDVRGIAKISGNFGNIPYTETGASLSSLSWNISMSVNTTNIVLNSNSDWSSGSGFVTIRYTKTTD